MGKGKTVVPKGGCGWTRVCKIRVTVESREYSGVFGTLKVKDEKVRLRIFQPTTASLLTKRMFTNGGLKWPLKLRQIVRKLNNDETGV